MDINELYFIGSNAYGQSGAGQQHKNKQYSEPISILFPIFIKQVSCGHHHSALLTIDGNVYTMGSNIHGTLAQSVSQLNYSFSPILVEGVKQVNKISSGAFHICALSEGNLYCWGKGIDGQLGTGNYVNSSTPTKILGLGNQIEDVSCGHNHTLVKSDQHCYAFGNGIYGQLGINNNKNTNQPVRVHLFNVEEIAAGDNHSLFISGGEVYGCGENKSNQTGTGLSRKYILEPKPTGLKNAVMIKAGKISAAMTGSGELYVWGGHTNHKVPTLSQMNENILDIKVGNETIYCHTAKGELHQYKYTQTQAVHSKLNISTSAILDFSIGEYHSLILGDIVSQATLSEKTLKTLTNLKNNLSEQSSFSINSEHSGKIPSALMKEHHSFHRTQSSQILGKVEKIMKMLQKNSNIEVDNYSLNRTQTSNKENINLNDESKLTNKKLILELRQKQLKISELQDKLSRKDMEIESQKELIKLLTKLHK